MLVVAGAALAYHGLQLRDDQRLAAEAPAEPELVQAAAPADATPASRSRALTLVGPTDADLDAALAAARAALPPGVDFVTEGD